jgi:hypothetical protein
MLSLTDNVFPGLQRNVCRGRNSVFAAHFAAFLFVVKLPSRQEHDAASGVEKVAFLCCLAWRGGVDRLEHRLERFLAQERRQPTRNGCCSRDVATRRTFFGLVFPSSNAARLLRQTKGPHPDACLVFLYASRFSIHLRPSVRLARGLCMDQLAMSQLRQLRGAVSGIIRNDRVAPTALGSFGSFTQRSRAGLHSFAPPVLAASEGNDLDRAT